MKPACCSIRRTSSGQYGERGYRCSGCDYGWESHSGCSVVRRRHYAVRHRRDHPSTPSDPACHPGVQLSSAVPDRYLAPNGSTLSHWCLERPTHRAISCNGLAGQSGVPSPGSNLRSLLITLGRLRGAASLPFYLPGRRHNQAIRQRQVRWDRSS